jgi:Mn-dependent DtxR family transcriptional regulator
MFCMTRKSHSRLMLTGAQADCLAVLRTPGCSKSEIAIEARRSIKQTDVALRGLAELGLAEQTVNKLWAATSRGKTCDFATIPDRSNRNRPPGPGAQRLLDLLDRPMRGRAIVQRLAISPQRVRQLLVRLHAQGRVVFCDPDRPTWLVKRADDESRVLSRDEECVLSMLPRAFATDRSGLSVATGLTQGEVEPIVENLIAAGLAEAREGLRPARAFRITAAGLEHPQYVRPVRHAPPQRLPVQSDRVRKVLQEISDAGVLRIRDVSDRMQLPRQSINALMQYLKRRQLITKAARGSLAPYSLTEQGRAVLAEMTLRQAA